MVPFSKEQNRRIYITALVISFLLIVGSIYLHLRQKTHLGRISFHFDSDRMQPTSGVKNSSCTTDNNYESKTIRYDEEVGTTIQPDRESNEEMTSEHYTAVYYGKENSSSNSNSNSTEEILNGDEDMESERSSSEEMTNERYNDEENSLSNSNSNSTEELLNGDMESEMIDDYDTTCLQCLCMTLNECKPTICGSVSCGKFMISLFYWSDAGQPRVEDGSSYLSDSIEHYKCANDDKCSQRAVRQYFERYRRDCNRDGVIDCRDQIALHLLGPSGCLRLNVSQKHEVRMNSCFKAKNFDYFDSYSQAQGDY
ncbi:hypothetical protein DOY81_001784 [Sarcophaga bullata]|nr:hypothetical protein DOY81_001784 [Sarcophaga bullata]